MINFEKKLGDSLEKVVESHNTLSKRKVNNVKPPLKNRFKAEFRKNGIVYIVLIPVLIHFLIFQVIPFVYSFILTFLDYRIIGNSEFVGLQNWKQLFQDPIAIKSIWNTVLFS